MQEINSYLFNLLNAPADPFASLVALARFLANWMIYVAAGAMVWAWARGRAETRSRLFTTGMTAVAALLFNFAIAAAWYHPRPFEIGVGHQFLPHAPETSFPSDHATVLFAFAFGLIGARASAFWSGFTLFAALSVSWSRVYLGVHWPLDMARSFVVALIAATVVAMFMNLKQIQAIRDGILKIYDRILDALGVPDSLSPRTFAEEGSR